MGAKLTVHLDSGKTVVFEKQNTCQRQAWVLQSNISCIYDNPNTLVDEAKPGKVSIKV